MQTNQLYYQQCYSTSFSSIVLECKTKEQNANCKDNDILYLIVLENTLFYPEGGGQPADKGTLNGMPVLDVQEKDGIIYHTVSQPFPVSKTIEGTIDWAHRYDLMRNHTAEHIISGIVHEMWGYDNVGFRMGKDVITLDFNGKLSIEDVIMLEKMANQKAAENKEVLVHFPDNDALHRMHYRSKKALTGSVRIVEVPGADICACCGLHVARTGEVGLIKILSVQSYKGGVRLSMVAGDRALADYCEKSENIQKISVCLSAPPNQAAKAVQALKEERDALRYALTQCQRELFMQKLNSLPDGIETAVFIESTMDSKQVKNLTNLALEKASHYAAVFAGDDQNGYSFMIATKRADAQEIAKGFQEAFGCKAGGSKEFIQGKVLAEGEKIKAYF